MTWNAELRTGRSGVGGRGWGHRLLRRSRAPSSGSRRQLLSEPRERQPSSGSYRPGSVRPRWPPLQVTAGQAVGELGGRAPVAAPPDPAQLRVRAPLIGREDRSSRLSSSGPGKVWDRMPPRRPSESQNRPCSSWRTSHCTVVTPTRVGASPAPGVGPGRGPDNPKSPG